jgi:hypothetical protein
MAKPIPRPILNILFGLRAATVEAMLQQYDADLIRFPLGAGKSLEAGLKQMPKMPAYLRRMLIMVDCMSDGDVEVHKDVRLDNRVIYHLRRSHALDITLAWDGREFVVTTGARIEDWLRGDVATL